MPNVLTAIVPQLLAQALPVLRANSVMPRLVNRQYETMAARQGDTINVPVSAAIAVQDVVPGPVPPTVTGNTPTTVPVLLDQWKEAPFYLTDKEQQEVMEGHIPMQAQEAIKALANYVDSFILGLYTGFYGYVGTAGVTPLATADSLADVIAARTVLNRQLAPMGDRKVVLDPSAEGNALNQRALQDARYRNGEDNTLKTGIIGTAIGMDWYMDQNVPTHTKGTAAGYIINGTMTLGSKTLTVSTGTGTFVVGDIITIAGDTQTYVITAAASSGATSLSIEPGLKAVPANSAAISIKGSHVVNLAFHPQAIAFASRPLSNNNAEELGSIIESAIDPISGIILRLEVTREHRQVKWSFDILFGGKVVRRELGVRIAG